MPAKNCVIEAYAIFTGCGAETAAEAGAFRKPLQPKNTFASNMPIANINGYQRKSTDPRRPLLASKWRGARRRPAMVGRLFVCIGELDHVPVIVGTSQKGNPGWKVVAGKTGGDCDRGNIH